MKRKIFLAMAALVCSMSMSAQTMKIYKGTELVKEYPASEADKVVFEEAASKLLPGKYSVSATKQVQFTKANIYWDGSAFKFEANQYDYPTTWNTTHIGHFFWTKTAAASYAASYSDGTCETSDKFFADGSDADHMLTVEGTSDLYVLSRTEWDYLLNRKVNGGWGEGNSYQRTTLTLSDGSTTVYGVILLPDNYSGTPALGATTTWADWQTMESAGFVFLPAAGLRNGSTLGSAGTAMDYWSATATANVSTAFALAPATTYITTLATFRSYGYPMRLVK